MSVSCTAISSRAGRRLIVVAARLAMLVLLLLVVPLPLPLPMLLLLLLLLLLLKSESCRPPYSDCSSRRRFSVSAAAAASVLRR